ncbi:SAP domain-containing protein [Leucobacter sp. Z1108]|uniref:SAP domain-containing protein n=1 Tax=Leucobacter sp. Z1108 TaxID=3439066 RepID=UPI003F3EC69E
MKVRATVNLFDPEMNVITLVAGDEIPEWAIDKITNPDILDREPPAAAPQHLEEAPEVDYLEPYAKTSAKDARAMLTERGLPAEGKVAELRQRLAEHDRETAETEPGDGTVQDLWTLTVEQLREIASELGLAHEPEASADELAALIDSNRG